MVRHRDQAEEYRQKAEELRAMLPDIVDKQTREMLENVAAGYDQLARVQETLAKTETGEKKD